MSDISDIAKLNFISDLISDIELILSRHAGSAKALADVEGKHALLMCLQQIGESLGKIKKPVMAGFTGDTTGQRNAQCYCA